MFIIRSFQELPPLLRTLHRGRLVWEFCIRLLYHLNTTTHATKCSEHLHDCTLRSVWENGAHQVGRSVEKLIEPTLIARLNMPVGSFRKVFVGDHQEMFAGWRDEFDFGTLRDRLKLFRLIQDSTCKYIVVIAASDCNPNDFGRAVSQPWPAVVNDNLDVIGISRMKSALKLRMIPPWLHLVFPF